MTLLTAAEAYRPISLDTKAAGDNSTETLGDLLRDDDPSCENLVDRTAVRSLLDDLPTRERTVLLYCFFGNKTQTEIGQVMDISQVQVSRLIHRALHTLQEALLEDA